jgi:hypothetical protein
MKFWGWILRIVVAALGISLFMLQSQYAKKSILEFFLNQPVKNSSMHVEANGIRGLFPFQIEVASLELRNKDGIIAALHDVQATWSMPDLVMQDVKFFVSMKNQLGGEVIYHINKHALLITLQGDGYNIWQNAFLKSLVIDLSELTLVRGKVIAKVEYEKLPIAVSVRLEEVDDDLMLIKDINVTGQDMHAEGSCGVYPKEDNFEADVALSIKDLSTYSNWFGDTIAGHAALSCHKKRNHPLNVHLQLGQFRFDHCSSNTLDLKAEFKDTKKQWVLLGQSVVLNNIPLTQLTANGQFDDKQGDFNCTGKGPNNISLHLLGDFLLPTPETPSKEVTITRAELSHPDHQLVLKKPVSIKWDDTSVHMPLLMLNARGGTVTVQEFLINNTILSSTITIDRFPLTILSIVYPNWNLIGNLSGKGKLHGTLEQPEGELSLDAKELHMGKVSKASQLNTDVSASLKLSQGMLDWQAKLSSKNMLTLTSQGKLSVHPWLPTDDSTIDGSIKGQADMGIISALIQNGDLIQGQLLVDLTTKGQMKNPTLNGHFSVSNGLYENAAFGTLIRNIKMQGSANNQLLTLSSITGRDNAKGQVTGSGSLKLASLLTPEIDISLKLHKFIFAQNDEITGRGSGTLNFKGVLGSEDAKRAAITGDIIIKPIEIRLEDHTEKMVTIQLLEKKKDGTYQTSKEKQKQVEKERSTVQIPLNIKLTSPEDIFVRGYGFDARWKGDMYAKGTLFDPYLVGDITLVRGKFDLLGKPLKLTEGKISYTEHPKNDPMMAILGSREVGEITAMMRIEGHASKPSITFSSSPALPQEEVLARILFGRGIESISVTQSLMLASALSTFKGKNNLNFTDKIRTAFGLDVLEFKEKKSADDDSFQSSSQQVSVGKQLTDKIYLSLDQSVSGDSGTSATVQLDVTPSLKLEADVGGNTNTGVGFSWVKKY